MFRAYEDPHMLQERLDDAQKRLSEAQAAGVDVEDLVFLHEDVEELKERLNFAWQDEEYDEYCEG